MAKVFADTNVLFPFSLMDLMLALTENDVHELMWTDRLLAEWERVICREHHRTAAQATSIIAAVHEFVGHLRIGEAVYAHLIDAMPGTDPDDRHHAAAASAVGA